jgi:hypothetical protein
MPTPAERLFAFPLALDSIDQIVKEMLQTA